MTDSKSITVVWLRQDLRLEDNPALYEAAKQGSVIPLYIYDTSKQARPMGGASKWWLHHSLSSLATSFKKAGLPLVLRQGTPKDVFKDLLKEHNIASVMWNRRYEPDHIKQDSEIKAFLEKEKISCQSFNGSLLFEPWEIQTLQGQFFKVFTPFWKRCQKASPRTPLKCPEFKKPAAVNIASDTLESLALCPGSPDWASKFSQYWQPGEAQAFDKLVDFAYNNLTNYAHGRDIPSEQYTSLLSPHLHFGEISPNTVYHYILKFSGHPVHQIAENNITRYLSELGWREFSYHLLYHLPTLPDEPFRPEFAKFPWEKNSKQLRQWQQGKTGIPIVDAGMRELWETGYMHNRVRMIVASFLTKHLLLHWKEGEKWFWDTLVDADLANNSASWQWVAGCGADAAPYFRIFNPVVQGERFDPDGIYVKKWVPELRKLDKKAINKPWEISSDILAHVGIKLGETYPTPIIDLKEGRERALEAYQHIKKS